MPVPARGQSQSPGPKAKAKSKARAKKEPRPQLQERKGVHLTKLWCAAHVEGNCPLGLSCPVPHHDKDAIEANKRALKNAKAAAKAEAKAKAGK